MQKIRSLFYRAFGTFRACFAPRALSAFFLAAMLAVSSTGCTAPGTSGTGSRGSGASSNRHFVVMASFYPLYLFAQNIAHGVPGVIVANMTAPTTGCLHDYSLTAHDMKMLDAADLFIYNGASLENFMGTVTSERPTLKLVEASRGLSLLKDPEAEGGVNAHVWVSITGALGEVRNIASALEEADPPHAAIYHRNAALYEAQLAALGNEMRRALAPCKGAGIVTFHEAFPYFAEEFGLKEAAVVESDPGTQPTAAQLNAVIGVVKNEHIRAVFTEPQYTPLAARTVQQETGCALYTLDPVVTGPMNDRNYYIEAMHRNLTALKKALG